MKRNSSAAIVISLLICALVSCKKGVTTPSEPAPDPVKAMTFSGYVTQNGQRAAGVKLYLSGDASRTAVTGGAGEFMFDVEGFRFIITPSMSGVRFAPSNVSLAGRSRTDLAFDMATPIYGSKIEEMAADFSLLNQHSKPVSLYEFFGSVLLLNFTPYG